MRATRLRFHGAGVSVPRVWRLVDGEAPSPVSYSVSGHFCEMPDGIGAIEPFGPIHFQVFLQVFRKFKSFHPNPLFLNHPKPAPGKAQLNSRRGERYCSLVQPRLIWAPPRLPSQAPKQCVSITKSSVCGPSRGVPCDPGGMAPVQRDRPPVKGP